MSADVPAFHAYSYPKPNMLVQIGSKVLIHGLQSEEGQKLNGRTGTALNFYPSNARWSVRVDKKKGGGGGGEETEEGKSDNDEFKIHIKNLVLASWESPQAVTDGDGDGTSPYICYIDRKNPSWSMCTEFGRYFIRAGTMGNGNNDSDPPALCLLDRPNGEGPGEPYLRERLPEMGVPMGMLDSLVGLKETYFQRGYTS